jgi:hypothetical protein
MHKLECPPFFFLDCAGFILKTPMNPAYFVVPFLAVSTKHNP